MPKYCYIVFADKPAFGKAANDMARAFDLPSAYITTCERATVTFSEPQTEEELERCQTTLIQGLEEIGGYKVKFCYRADD